ncbi:hypothetical protein AB0393_04180 [Streptomyces cyaneofuscatus]|uniref:hypothetical protein n=1 Tax=Streptomyces TaxID=1883 RepID=UPI00344F9394
MNAKAVEIDLGQHGMQAALAVLSGQICVLVRPGLSEQQLPVAIRSLLARYIHRPVPHLLLWPERDGQGVVVKEPDDELSDLVLEDPPDVTADIPHLYGKETGRRRMGGAATRRFLLSFWSSPAST